MRHIDYALKEGEYRYVNLKELFMSEQELLKNGYEREPLCFHIQEYDPQLTTDNKYRRLSYDLGRTFNSDQIADIKRVCDEVNKRFPNIKMFVSGTGFVKKEDNEEPSQD